MAKTLYFNNVDSQVCQVVKNVIGDPMLVHLRVYGATWRDLHDSAADQQVLGPPLSTTLPAGTNNGIQQYWTTLGNPSMQLKHVKGAAYYIEDPVIETGANYATGFVNNINVSHSIGVKGDLALALSDHIAHVPPRQALQYETFWRVPVEYTPPNEPKYRFVKFSDYPSAFSDDPPSFAANYPAALAANHDDDDDDAGSGGSGGAGCGC